MGMVKLPIKKSPSGNKETEPQLIKWVFEEFREIPSDSGSDYLKHPDGKILNPYESNIYRAAALHWDQQLEKWIPTYGQVETDNAVNLLHGALLEEVSNIALSPNPLRMHDETNWNFVAAYAQAAMEMGYFATMGMQGQGDQAIITLYIESRLDI